jgi:hypothetical protein
MSSLNENLLLSVFLLSSFSKLYPKNTEKVYRGNDMIRNNYNNIYYLCDWVTLKVELFPGGQKVFDVFAGGLAQMTSSLLVQNRTILTQNRILLVNCYFYMRDVCFFSKIVVFKSKGNSNT